MLWSETASAQTSVRARVGEHDGYSRIVFDWPKRQSYSAKSDGDTKLILDFGTEASLSNALSSPAASYISGFEVISKNPLKVALSFPTGARTRHFAAGRRVVVDVYAVPGAKPLTVAKAEPVPVPKAAPKTPEPKDEKPAPVESAVPDQKALKPPVEDKKDVEPPPAPLLQKIAEAEIKPAAITLSSSRAQGMAVFKMNGEIYLANDQADLLLDPQITGPGAKNISSLRPVRAVNGKVYRTKVPKNLNVRGQGGGLVWRVVMSPEPHKKMPALPKRVGIKDGEARSGKIFWPLKEASEIVTILDPVTGVEVKAITVRNAKYYAGAGHDFIDFRTLPSIAGLAIVPKVDDLKIKITDAGVEISRASGLAILPENRIAEVAPEDSHDEAHDIASGSEYRIFDFKSWDIGGIQTLTPNTNVILGSLHEQSDTEKADNLVNLAKMYLTNAQGAEALGFLEYAESLQPELEANPSFLALKGAAQAIDLKSEDAFRNLSHKNVKPISEIGYWRAFVLSDLGDWVQAKEVLPESYKTLYNYTPLVMNKLALVLAEVELRSGTVDNAEDLLSAVERNADTLFPPQAAALSYLKGEAARQQGKLDETKKRWKDLLEGKDDLYRVKAGLAYSRLLVNEGVRSPAESIDSLERLRYAWRGDELESQVYYWLGRTYFEAKEYVKGLNILREAATIAAGTDLGTRIAAEMTDEFTKLFLGEELNNVSPPDAAALYEQFSELVPVGPQGDRVVERLAEHMVQADLLERAAGMLSHQLEHRLQGAEAYRVGVRLAAIYLLDGKAEDALRALEKAKAAFEALPVEMKTTDKTLEMSLLRARALSWQNRPDQALSLLERLDNLPQVNRLRSDIAWNAAYWDDAADALEDVVLDENISLTRPLNEDHATLILNRAVALNLASDRVALANMREKYSDAMAQTPKSRLFEVVTRPRQSAALADRETLLSIVSETDLFGDFLESYRQADTPSQ